MQLINSILLPLLFLGMMNPLKSQNTDLHQGAKVGIGVAAVAGIAAIAVLIAVSSGIIGYALLERGKLPGALVFGGISLTLSVVAILKKRQWENTVSQRLDLLK
jgi:apolipoprotein N-acyltransferase